MPLSITPAGTSTYRHDFGGGSTRVSFTTYWGMSTTGPVGGVSIFSSAWAAEAPVNTHAQASTLLVQLG
ncbi:MAG: hypothetical protein QM760_21770 [Nibricoccus sp.]